MRIAQRWGIDPTVIRKTWTIYDVCDAHEAMDLELVGQHAAHEIAQRNARTRR